jgi:hypothetical protein
LFLPAKTYVSPVPQTVVIGKKSIWVTNKIKLQWITKKPVFNPWNTKLIKSAKARVTGTIPYCHGKVPHSRKLLSLCSNDFKRILLKSMDWWWKLFQGNSDIMIDSCTYIYIYTSFGKGYYTRVFANNSHKI